MKRAIRNLSSKKLVPTHLFDVVIDEDNPQVVYIEQKVIDRKDGKAYTERALWNDVINQVESAVRDSKAV
ncbi:MAG: hypothetical protein IJR39_07840 [Treponema sp.]|nr:hypothetical protein [Treponema sp.]